MVIIDPAVCCKSGIGDVVDSLETRSRVRHCCLGEQVIGVDLDVGVTREECAAAARPGNMKIRDAIEHEDGERYDRSAADVIESKVLMLRSWENPKHLSWAFVQVLVKIKCLAVKRSVNASDDASAIEIELLATRSLRDEAR